MEKESLGGPKAVPSARWHRRMAKILKKSLGPLKISGGLRSDLTDVVNEFGRAYFLRTDSVRDSLRWGSESGTGGPAGARRLPLVSTTDNFSRREPGFAFASAISKKTVARFLSLAT